jgi:hypothetical protein
MGNSAKGCFVENPDALIKQRAKSASTKKLPQTTTPDILAHARSKLPIVVTKYVSSKSVKEGEEQDLFDATYYEMRFSQLRDKYHTAEYLASANKPEDIGIETRTINKQMITDKWPELQKSYYGSKVWGAIDKANPDTVHIHEFMNSYPSFQTREQFARCKLFSLSLTNSLFQNNGKRWSRRSN